MLLQVLFHQLLDVQGVIIFTDLHVLDDLFGDRAQIKKHANDVRIVLARALVTDLCGFFQQEVDHFVFESILILKAMPEMGRSVAESLLVQHCTQHSVPWYIHYLSLLWIASLHVLQNSPIINFHPVVIVHLLTL